MRVSVVIPTFNRAGLLRKTVPALASQKTTGDMSYEVIFVSNGSSDDSDAILKEAVARFPEKLRYFYIDPTGGPSAPRNVGIRAASGDVVIILDDDVLPDPDLVLRHAEFHKTHPEPHQAAIGELYIPEHLRHDPMAQFHGFPYDEVRRLSRLTYLHFWSCNVSVKRQFMLDAGMFDESFLYYEDMLCGYRLANKGMQLHFLPSARGQHLHQLKPSGVAAKGLFTGRWLYALIERLPDPAAKERFGVLSLDLPAGVLLKRVVRRMAFRIVDNPATMVMLKLAGATRGKRSRVGDLYYYIIFRRNVVAGYYEAKRLARDGEGRTSRQTSTKWVDRGES
jgi:glycosyltransferase involved in cell wall biosynthesis